MSDWKVHNLFIYSYSMDQIPCLIGVNDWNVNWFLCLIQSSKMIIHANVAFVSHVNSNRSFRVEQFVASGNWMLYKWYWSDNTLTHFVLAIHWVLYYDNSSIMWLLQITTAHCFIVPCVWFESICDHTLVNSLSIVIVVYIRNNHLLAPSPPYSYQTIHEWHNNCVTGKQMWTFMNRQNCKPNISPL